MYISKVVWSADQFKYFFDCILSTARLRTKSLNFVSTFAPMLSLAAHPGKASPALQADAFCDCTSKQKASRLGQYQVKLQPSFHFLYKHTYGINMSNSAIIVLTVGEAMYTSIDTTFTESEKALKSALIQHAAGLILSALLLPAHLIRWMAANAVFVRAKSPAEGVSARAANITFVCWIPLSCSTEDTHNISTEAQPGHSSSHSSPRLCHTKGGRTPDTPASGFLIWEKLKGPEVLTNTNMEASLRIGKIHESKSSRGRVFTLRLVGSNPQSSHIKDSNMGPNPSVLDTQY